MMMIRYSACTNRLNTASKEVHGMSQYRLSLQSHSWTTFDGDSASRRHTQLHGNMLAFFIASFIVAFSSYAAEEYKNFLATALYASFLAETRR